MKATALFRFVQRVCELRSSLLLPIGAAVLLPLLVCSCEREKKQVQVKPDKIDVGAVDASDEAVELSQPDAVVPESDAVEVGPVPGLKPVPVAELMAVAAGEGGDSRDGLALSRDDSTGAAFVVEPEKTGKDKAVPTEAATEESVTALITTMDNLSAALAGVKDGATAGKAAPEVEKLVTELEANQIALGSQQATGSSIEALRLKMARSSGTLGGHLKNLIATDDADISQHLEESLTKAFRLILGEKVAPDQ